ncbi:restriction endonuclease subunit M [Phormidesmis priestleyi ULC007]|uniref:Restriction endonuclease subunit M n=1 Tax=Phormidesmis priestleyi ULC007 TaxID=1920490 RepID=A0A2T1DET5_9CYAN|nr:N-6 DNA methylase [Phormidesmis priestleyi]PSB19030.1 restriction endonuclease subunit M [Phormidesmis priestleyi ULC007]PZO54018.1 MAG: restriction endonuclease subunit M [Phormidesmis priestleyi]
MPKRSEKSDVRQLALIQGLGTPKEIFRNLRNYLAGQFVGATRDETLLDELLKCLFCKLYVELKLVPPLEIEATSIDLSKTIRSVFAKVREGFPDIYNSQSEILLDPETIYKVMTDCSFSLIDATSDPIGDAFEVFVGSESRSRSGQFFTPRSVTDLLVKAVDPRPGESIIDPACGAGGFLTSVSRYWIEEGFSAQEISKFATDTFFGIDKDDYLVNLAKLHVSLLTGGHPSILCGDSLALQDGLLSVREKADAEGFDVLLANPPFGVNIVAARPEVLDKFQLARKWKFYPALDKWSPTSEVRNQVSPQILFVERCLSLLKVGGRMGIVLPESILSNKSYRYVVEYLLEKSNIQAVIGMPEALFKTSGKGGTHTKTCLLVAEKKGESSKEKSTIFMAEAKWCGQDSRARIIDNNDLPKIGKHLKLAKNNEAFDQSSLGFLVDIDSVQSKVLCPRYYDPQVNENLISLENTHALLDFGQLVKDGVLKVSTGDELGKLAYGTGDIPFIRTSDISNWELKADPKHGVAHQIFESLRKKQDIQANDILMVKDGTYLIGTCAIVTEYDCKIIYQSHLYKVRVMPNSLDLNPFLLLAVLSSPVVQRQVKSKQFTQDIIDSLGERINELVLPIPKSEQLRHEITEMVRTSINDRVEARELAKKARLAVAGS